MKRNSYKRLQTAGKRVNMFEKQSKKGVKNALTSGNEVVECPEIAGMEPEERPSRVPMTQQFKLSIPSGIQKKGYVYRYIRDTAERVEAFQAAWWEPVADGLGKPIRKASGERYLLLYRIEEKYYLEDLKIKEEKPINLLREQAKLAKGRLSHEYIPEGHEGVVVIKH